MLKNSFIINSSYTFYFLCLYADFLITAFYGDIKNELNMVAVYFSNFVGFTWGLAFYTALELTAVSLLIYAMKKVKLVLAPSMFLLLFGIFHLQGGLHWVVSQYYDIYRIPAITVLIVFLVFDLLARKMGALGGER